MSIQLLPAAERRDEPWLNGGGVTSPVAARPAGAGTDAFDWRVSIATVDVDGPFSYFAGVDRCLSVLDGTMRLVIEGGRSVELDVRTPPLEFPGDVGVDSAVLVGPVTDLNLMVRRGRWGGTTRRLVLQSARDLAVERPVMLLLLADGAVACGIGGERYDLGARDALLLEDEVGTRLRLEPASEAVVYLVETWPQS